MTTPTSLEQRTQALSRAAADWLNPANAERRQAVRLTLESDNAFTAEAVNEAIRCVMSRVTERALRDWFGPPVDGAMRRVCVLNAGNIPFVGLQDLLAVVLSGHQYLGVTSTKSPHLLPAFSATVQGYDPSIQIAFVSLEEARAHADALIATGSSATTQMIARQFRAVGVPSERQLLRGTRFAAAIVDGSESEEDLYRLSRDAFLHEGRGCRSVAVVLAPRGTGPERFAEQAHVFRSAFPPHPSTRKAIARAVKFLRAVEEPFVQDAGFLIVEGDVTLREPCVLRWIQFDDVSDAAAWLDRNERRLQVVIQGSGETAFSIESVESCDFGSAQDPELDWRPDGIDVVSFLRAICGTSL